MSKERKQHTGNPLMKGREGDFIETFDGLISDVKGFVHPCGSIVAFPRYFPSKKGERSRDGRSFEKAYSLSERYARLRHRFPQYLIYDSVFDAELCEIPISKVRKRYDPIRKLRELRFSDNLDNLETKILRLAGLLKEKSGIPWDSVGVSGSILVGLHRSGSDLDLVVYGSEHCRSVHNTLKRLLKQNTFELGAYTHEQLKWLFDFRSKDSAGNFEAFVRTESRKVLQGTFSGTDYFVRFVKDWNEQEEKYGEVLYQNAGRGTIRAFIKEDRESIFTPCRYDLKNVEAIGGIRDHYISEIVSFRGRFCEQAKKGEVVKAQGKVEKVVDLRLKTSHSRLLIGNNSSDYMILES